MVKMTFFFCEKNFGVSVDRAGAGDRPSCFFISLFSFFPFFVFHEKIVSSFSFFLVFVSKRFHCWH